MKRGHIKRNEIASTPKQQEFVDSFPYSEIVGALLYLSVVTRVDIAYAVGVLTRHMKCPTFDACTAVCRLLNYLSVTRTKGIRYRSRECLSLMGFCDSDWASDVDTRRSTSGNIVLMANGPVSWMSKLQPIVATSSMEAEYISCYFLIQEITWIRALLKSVGLARKFPTIVYIDNKSAVSLANNPVYHQRSKHIDVKFHWLRSKIQDKTVFPQYLSTSRQLADMLTKVIDGAVFHTHLSDLMVDVV